ncbi:MAG: glycogen-debranching protein [Planctomycetales bacterium]|nr:glycogen-debranching protein [Planctomycetales bacterium]
MSAWTTVEGAPFPLGTTWIPEERAYNFALYSKHAHRVSLQFYLHTDLIHPVYEFSFNPLANKSGPIWHCRLTLDELDGSELYAYRIDGPPAGPGYTWHTFDPEKLLLDPYARDIYFPPTFDRHAALRPGSNVGKAPLAVLRNTQCPFTWEHDDPAPLPRPAPPHHPIRHTHDLVIYEMHVRGFTRRDNSGVSDEKRGTFAGVVEKIPYLKQLGVTAVELMPIFQFDPQEGNYWGYMPINFFSPHEDYSVSLHECLPEFEFRDMVKSLHAAGIEVILDVVYNHTGEGNEHGPTYSFKGIDNTTYYMVSGEAQQPYSNFSGTGNTLHTVNRAVRQLIIDSLRYWAREMGVDGFRFDLASIFSRDSDGSIRTGDPPIFGQIAADPELANVRLIAEPWDAGGLYQLGRRFPGVQWMQWNGSYRDVIQRYVRGDAGMVSELMSRLYGSADLFPDDRLHAMRPFQSVNYVSSHDGFSLYDLVSYNHKRNWANGHDNLDGHDDFSWNCGWEGDAGAPDEVLATRQQQVKNCFCLLMLSNGTPMFRMGDEFLQTQQGNNNPFNQDNETTWLDWEQLSRHGDAFRFFAEMIAFRKRHPSISRSRFWREDVKWHGVDYSPDLTYDSHSLALCLHGESQQDTDIYVMSNAWWHELRFGIHEGQPGEWRRVVDTSLSSPRDIVDESTATPLNTAYYVVAPRSTVVLTRS